MIRDVKNVWVHLSKRRRNQFFILNILMVLSSISEIISIGAVIPFLGFLANPEIVYQHQIVQPIINAFNLTSPDQLLLPLTTGFIAAALLAGLMRLLLFYTITRFSYAVGADLSINVYMRTLYQEYMVHVLRNSNEVINVIISKIGGVVSVVQGFLSIISSTILIIFIVITLFAIDPTVALVALFGFGSLYLIVARLTSQKLKDNSRCIASQSTQRIKSLREGLGGIRDVLLDNSQQFYCDLYRDADLSMRRALGNNQFIRFSPRYIMEIVGVAFITGMAYTMSLQEDGRESIIPVLGALALGAQRLLPALQLFYGSYASIKGSRASFYDVIDLLSQTLPDYAGKSLSLPIPFKKNISLSGIKFRYSDGSPWIINETNLEIIKGERVGFIGTTGSGKSTLLDIIMGLLAPTEGSLLVDGKSITVKNLQSWQMNISHVPQNIYLSDCTVEENIAFGVPKEKIDRNLVKKVAKQAQISGVIEGWENQYQTLVGERGVFLSGGQSQRIGIARALYRKSNILIFDEATSALDSETEQLVMKSIYDLGREFTILIIAHRLSTLKGCDRIIDLNINKLHEFNGGKYEPL